MYAVDSVPDLNERALRQQRSERNTSGGLYRSDTDASLLDTGNGTRGDGSYETQSSGGGGGVGGSGGRRGSGGRSRLAPKYVKDYVDDVVTEDSDGPGYVARPSKRRGRPPSSARLANDDDDSGDAKNRSAAVENILAQEQKRDAELMKQVAAAEQQQQKQAQAVLAQQVVVQRIQQIQMLQAQGLPIPPEQLQFLGMLNQYQQQRQQQQQQPLPFLGGGAVGAAAVGVGSAVGGMLPVPTATAAAVLQQPGQQLVYFDQNLGAAVVPAGAATATTAAAGAAGDVSLAQWGGSGKRSHPTSKRVPPPP
jgi:hypothetical protein